MNRYLILIIILMSFGYQKVDAGQYSVNAGETLNLYCTASAPAGGWITHAMYELVDASDSKYLKLFSHSAECFATVTGVSAKSSIKILVTYVYSYRGTYDNKINVGHGTYYDYVTVKGGSAATGINFNPAGVNMKVGETVKVKIEMTPKNTSSTYNWGVTSISSDPSTYEIKENGNELTITAKRKMNLWLLAQTNNGLIGTCVIYAKDETPSDAVLPQEISLTTAALKIREGENQQLEYSLTPSNASTAIIWQSDNEDVCMVDAKGLLTAHKSGKTIVSATTSNGLKASCEVEVAPNLKSVILPSAKTIYIGYQDQLSPEVVPEGAFADWLWSSSDERIAVVDNSGLVTVRREGKTDIVVTSKENGTTAKCHITVKTPDKGTDIRNATQRLQSIDELVNQILHYVK